MIANNPAATPFATSTCAPLVSGRGDGSVDGGRIDGVVGVKGRAELGAEGLGCGIVAGRAADLFTGRDDGAVGGATLAGYVLGKANLISC